jgi:hypothetical protein
MQDSTAKTDSMATDVLIKTARNFGRSSVQSRCNLRLILAVSVKLVPRKLPLLLRYSALKVLASFPLKTVP